MVELVVVEITRLVALLFVDVTTVLLPRDFRDFVRIRVDPYKPVNINLDVDLVQAIVFGNAPTWLFAACKPSRGLHYIFWAVAL